MILPQEYFDLSKNEYADIFFDVDVVWDVIKRLPEYIKLNLKPKINGKVSPNAYIDNNVYIGLGTVVESGAVIKGPSIIGNNCEIRSGAYIRQNVLISNQVTVGHSTELKNCFIFDKVQIPHFSYIGDSILGTKSHLGAGVKISNFKINRTPVIVKILNKKYSTGLKKFGAIIGDEVEIGCNAVLNPGTLIGKRTLVYANLSLRGYYPSDSIVKLKQSIELLNKRVD